MTGRATPAFPGGNGWARTEDERKDVAASFPQGLSESSNHPAGMSCDFRFYGSQNLPSGSYSMGIFSCKEPLLHCLTLVCVSFSHGLVRSLRIRGLSPLLGGTALARSSEGPQGSLDRKARWPREGPAVRVTTKAAPSSSARPQTALPTEFWHSLTRANDVTQKNIICHSQLPTAF